MEDVEAAFLETIQDARTSEPRGAQLVSKPPADTVAHLAATGKQHPRAAAALP